MCMVGFQWGKGILSIRLFGGTCTIVISYVACAEIKQTYSLSKDSILNILLLKGVVRWWFRQINEIWNSRKQVVPGYRCAGRRIWCSKSTLLQVNTRGMKVTVFPSGWLFGPKTCTLWICSILIHLFGLLFYPPGFVELPQSPMVLYMSQSKLPCWMLCKGSTYVDTLKISGVFLLPVDCLWRPLWSRIELMLIGGWGRICSFLLPLLTSQRTQSKSSMMQR
jgi:hypothetical protein